MNANAPPKRIGVLLQTPINKNLRSTQSNSGVAISQACKHGTTRVELMPQGHRHHGRVICAVCGRFIRWSAKPANVEQQRSNVFRIAKLSMQEGLTRWERKFIRSIAHPNRLLPRQQQILDELAEKHLERRNHPLH